MNYKLLIAVGTVLMFAAGCASLSDAFGYSQDARDGLASERAVLVSELEAAVDAGDEERAAAINDAIADLNRADTAIADAQASAVKYMNEDGTVNVPAAAREVSLSLPFPANIAVLLGLPLVTAGVQEWRKSKVSRELNQAVTVATETVASVDAMREVNAELADQMSDKATRTAAWKAMSPETYRFINDNRNT
ncbi:MAG: hypothetical protein P1V36_06590 [Planctomycetota bacterium]|nr:hypothetical protein [Planctomycetota bacterium]